MTKIKLSFASAIKLGLRKGRIDFPLKTIYVMVGEKCRNSCKFCSQSRTSSFSYSNYLSRITWQEVNLSDFFNSVSQNNDIKRICLQIVSGEDVLRFLVPFTEELLSLKTTYKISISLASTDLAFLKHLFEIGVDTITIPLDCAKLETYKKIKGDDFKERVDTLLNLSKIRKNNVGTHLIYGLSDTEKDFYEIMKFLKSNSINAGLFSFTPLPGTELEKLPKPALNSYRKVQVIRALIYENISFEPEFSEYGNLLNLKIENMEKFRELMLSGKPFLTSGCDDCTRPYYNDSPRYELYNFFRPLTEKEIKTCIDEFQDGLESNISI